MIRKALLLCGVVFLSSAAALAQTDVSTIADPSPASAQVATPQVASNGLPDWQVAFTYQFTRLNMPSDLVGTHYVPSFTANENGYDVSFTRFLVSWGGLEADSAAGFGDTSTPLIKDSKSLFIGGGPRFAYRGHRVEPWGHVLVGLEHFRFSQTSTEYGSDNSVAFIGGGGVDLHFNPRTAFRLEVNYLGTAIVSKPEYNWQVGAGIVFDF